MGSNWHHSGSWYNQLWKIMRASEPLICHLCQRPIDRELRYPHRGSFTLDMIVPRSRGGQKVASNFASAHAFCNISKGGTNRDRKRFDSGLKITDEDEP